MELFARHDAGFTDEQFQVPRPSQSGGIREALRQSFRPATLPPEIVKLLSRLG